MDVNLLKNIIKLQLEDFELDVDNINTTYIMFDRELHTLTQENIDKVSRANHQFTNAIYLILDGNTRIQLGSLEKPTAGNDSMYVYQVFTNTKTYNKDYPPQLKIASYEKNKHGKFVWRKTKMSVNNFLIKTKLKKFTNK